MLGRLGCLISIVVDLVICLMWSFLVGRRLRRLRNLFVRRPVLDLNLRRDLRLRLSLLLLMLRGLVGFG